MSAFFFDIDKQRPRISRREAIRRAMFTASGLVLANHLSFRAFAAPPAARAKAVIQIWMWGGPSHIDIFDPKPDAGYDYCGPLKSPIETNVSGIRIGELLPRLAPGAAVDEAAGELRRAVIHGSVMGSFCCEKFGVDRFRTLTREEIEARYQEFKNHTSF